jgi:thiol-disulfide isomerase/thioredoxin
MTIREILSLALSAIAIGCLIYVIEMNKPPQAERGTVAEIAADDQAAPEALAAKKKKFTAARELAKPAGFINTAPFALRDLIGQQIIMVDFWTYSCINCQRTLPYLNAWHEKYGEQGLTIVGVHTPEFGFEQVKANVERAVSQYAVKYPVVLDNEYATWRAYGNRYWPRKYLIDIDGYIVYDHIGEGGYEETEQKIQELLAERAERLQTNETIAGGVVRPATPMKSAGNVGSPEVYFGSARNEFLSNGTPGKTGPQTFAAPADSPLNKLILSGTWDIQPEFARTAGPASIRFRYQAKEIYMVASAEEPLEITVTQDGVLQPNAITVEADQLYTIISNDAPGEHILELRVDSPGFTAFTFTFG